MYACMCECKRRAVCIGGYECKCACECMCACVDVSVDGHYICRQLSNQPVLPSHVCMRLSVVCRRALIFCLACRWIN